MIEMVRKNLLASDGPREEKMFKGENENKLDNSLLEEIAESHKNYLRSSVLNLPNKGKQDFSVKLKRLSMQGLLRQCFFVWGHCYHCKWEASR